MGCTRTHPHMCMPNGWRVLPKEKLKCKGMQKEGPQGRSCRDARRRELFNLLRRPVLLQAEA